VVLAARLAEDRVFRVRARDAELGALKAATQQWIAAGRHAEDTRAAAERSGAALTKYGSTQQRIRLDQADIT